MRRRSARWLWVLVRGLLDAPPVMLYDPAGKLHRIPQTRIALRLDPPDLPAAVTTGDSQDGA